MAKTFLMTPCSPASLIRAEVLPRPTSLIVTPTYISIEKTLEAERGSSMSSDWTNSSELDQIRIRLTKFDEGTCTCQA